MEQHKRDTVMSRVQCKYYKQENSYISASLQSPQKVAGGRTLNMWKKRSPSTEQPDMTAAIRILADWRMRQQVAICTPYRLRRSLCHLEGYRRYNQEDKLLVSRLF